MAKKIIRTYTFRTEPDIHRPNSDDTLECIRGAQLGEARAFLAMKYGNRSVAVLRDGVLDQYGTMIIEVDQKDQVTRFTDTCEIWVGKKVKDG